MEMAGVVIGLTSAAASIAGLFVVLVQVPRATRAAREARDAVLAQDSITTLLEFTSQLSETQAALRSDNWDLVIERLRLARRHVARMRGQPATIAARDRELHLQRAARSLGEISRAVESTVQGGDRIDVVNANEILAELLDVFGTMAEELRVEVGTRGDTDGD